MKILFFPLMQAGVVNLPSILADYQMDSVFHGLRSMLGPDCVDAFRLPHMYKGYEHISKLWGKGFSLYGLLDDIEIDRSDLESKIANRYFDYIILPIHHTIANDIWTIRAQLSVFGSYPPSRLAIIDGWDRTEIAEEFLDRGVYFKRELIERYSKAHPISFSIPKEKIVRKLNPNPTNDFAPLIPACHGWDCEHLKTYIYNEEEPYYQQYYDSKLAFNCKKGGWDTMRLYEIMANGCVPFFTDIELCPIRTLRSSPKTTLIDIKHMRGILLELKEGYAHFPDNPFVGDTIPILGGKLSSDFNNDKFQQYQEFLLDWTRNDLTTEATANYLMDKLCSI